MKGNIGTQKMISQNSGEQILAEVIIDDDEAMSWNCLFDIEPYAPSGAVGVSVDGRIQFGAAGISIDTGFFPILADATNPTTNHRGLSVVIHGAKIRVSARVRCSANPLAIFPIGAFISKNPPNKLYNAIQVCVVGATVPLGSFTSIVPPFAKSVSIFPGILAPFPLLMNIITDGGSVYSVDIEPGEKLIRYPLAQGQTVEITTTDPADPGGTVFSIIYEIEY